jgi:CBS domain-containing protein
MKVAEALRRPVKACTLLSSLEDVGRIMWEADQSAVPVVNELGRVVGLLSDRDLAVSMAAKNRGAAQILVRELLDREFITCSAEDVLAEAVRKMRLHRLRNIVAVGAEGGLVGVLSLEDLAHAADTGGGKSAEGVSCQEIVLALQAIGKTRQEVGETVPRWPWVNADVR